MVSLRGGLAAWEHVPGASRGDQSLKPRAGTLLAKHELDSLDVVLNESRRVSEERSTPSDQIQEMKFSSKGKPLAAEGNIRLSI